MNTTFKALLSLLVLAAVLASCGTQTGPAEGSTEAATDQTEELSMEQTTESTEALTAADTGTVTEEPQTDEESTAPAATQLSNLTVEITQDKACISREPGSFPTLPYYGWPSVAVDENDVTYVVVSKRLLHIDPYGKVMLYKSYDRGMTWDEGTCILDTMLDDRDAGIVYMGNGRMLVTSFSHNSSLYVTNSTSSYVTWQSKVSATEKQRVFDMWNAATSVERTGCSSYIISTDYGKTWSERHLMPVTAPHGPSLLKDGSLMYLGVPKAPKLATGQDLASGVYCYISTDGGETFEQRSRVAIDASYGACEAYGIQLENGRIVATVRTGSFHTMIFYSEDNGYTWSEAKDLTYGAPAQLLQASNGVVIMTYSKRSNTTGQVVRFSYDNGDKWTRELYVSRPASSTDTDLGYPATAQYSDGSFITVYYQKWESDSKPSLMRTLWQFKQN